MKRNEIIKLNDVEYTLELNRESAVRIEKYTNLQKTYKEISKPLFEYKEEIEEDENPFEDEIKLDEMQEEADKKLATLKDLYAKAFWIWLYPNHKLNITQVKEILEPYYEDDEKIKSISELYAKFMQLSTEISQKYMEEQKNLKAQTKK
jgi:hypothetical protein